jgi:pyruvate dehydrogenase E2 component (dihydrolipoamide acetyltransferase)
MEAGAIASWTLEEGESFGAGDVLCEVETDKATVSFEAQDDGVVAKILAEAGPTEIDCGVPILITVEEESDVDAFKDYVVEATTAAPPAAVASTPSTPPNTPRSLPPAAVASTPSTPPNTPRSIPPAAVASTPSTPPNTPRSIPPAAVASTPSTPPNTPRSLAGDRVVASPLAWTIAKEKGLDLTTIAIAGTGPEGRVIADDVKEYIPIEATAASTVAPTETAAVSAPPAEPVIHENYTDYPVNEASIQTANLLAHSKQTIPHYYLTVDVTLDSLIDLRSKLNNSLPEDGQLSVNDLLIKAAASAMKACPAANASWMGDSVRMYNSVDMNVVMGSGDTLYAPLIQGVDTRGVKSISDEVSSNLSDIEEGSVGVNPSFSAVGTVTFMNLGMYGVKSCAPIIRAPQAVAVALGAAENRVVPKEGGEGDDVYDTKVMLTATLSCDHRVVDGAVGASWLSAFKAAVESPETLLL